MKSKIIIIIVLVLLGIAGLLYYKGVNFNNLSKMHAGYQAINDSEGKDLTKFKEANNCQRLYPWGQPEVENKEINNRSLYFCANRYASQFDTNKKTVIWTTEILYKKDIVGFLTKKPKLNAKYKQMTAIPSAMQLFPGELANTNYTESFAIPPYTMYSTDAGKNIEENIKINNSLVQESLLMTNVIPMNKGLANGMWKVLENSILNDMYSLRGERLFLTVGSLYLNDQDLGEIGKSKVKIPPYIYVIMTNPTTYSSISYILPNKDIVYDINQQIVDPKNAYYCYTGDKQIRTCGLMDFAVSVMELERITNIKFYPLLAPYYSIKVKKDIKEYLEKMNAQ